jgi:hypothetical protein
MSDRSISATFNRKRFGPIRDAFAQAMVACVPGWESDFNVGSAILSAGFKAAA